MNGREHAKADVLRRLREIRVGDRVVLRAIFGSPLYSEHRFGQVGVVIRIHDDGIDVRWAMSPRTASTATYSARWLTREENA